MLVPTVFVESKSVEALLGRAVLATSTASMMAWLSGPMTRVLQQRAQERFLGQGEDVSSGGWKGWKELAAATVSFRAAAGYGPTPINVRTGELERYVTGAQGAVSATGVGAALRWPGNAPGGILAAKVMRAQGGDPKTPARPVIGLAAPDVALGLASLAGWLEVAIMTGNPGGGVS